MEQKFNFQIRNIYRFGRFIIKTVEQIHTSIHTVHETGTNGSARGQRMHSCPANKDMPISCELNSRAHGFHIAKCALSHTYTDTLHIQIRFDIHK